MLKIRLQRVGRKHEPVFRLVLTDSKNSTKSGKFLEILGNFDSRKSENAVFEEERIQYWISQGAQASDTVHNLLVTRKIVEGKKRNSLPKKKPIAKEGGEAPAAVAETVAETPEAPAPEVMEEAATEAAAEEPAVEVVA